MRPIATLDLETDPFKLGRIPRAFAGCLYTGQTFFVDWSSDCCRVIVFRALDYAKTVKGGVLFYAHNGGKFDFHFLLTALLERFDAEELQVTSIGSRIVKLKTPICEFRDSYSVLPRPLSAIGNKKEIEIEKLEEDVREKHRKEITEYLKQDCVALFDALTEFFDKYGCEITLASTTFKVLKKDFGIKPINTGEDYDSNFRRFYFAGRVQFWKLGKSGETDGQKRFTIVDINSAFPWAMLKPHWFGKEYRRIDKAPEKYAEQSFFHITCDSDGALPFREESGGVSFPKREGETFFVTGWEYLAALDLGMIGNVKIKSVFVPETVQDFEPYVSHFYEMKRNAKDPFDREAAKLFLNSCYGKFGTDCRSFRDVKITKFGDVPEPRLVLMENKQTKLVPWEHSYDRMSDGLSFWQLPTNDPEALKPLRFYNVCTAASITGCVRAFLQRSIAACKGVMYCDTDSIIAEDVSTLTLSEDLGAWKLEKDCDAVWIGGKKLYAAHAFNSEEIEIKAAQETDKKKAAKLRKQIWKTASKGVRLSVPDLVSVCEGEARTCSFDAPNFSVFSAPRFVSRTVTRDDKRKKKK